jgi:hypothetical protein
VQNLIDIYQAKGFKARLRRMFASSAKIRRVALKAVLTEYQSQGDERTSRNEMDELYSRGVTPHFRDFSKARLRHVTRVKYWLLEKRSLSWIKHAKNK